MQDRQERMQQIIMQLRVVFRTVQAHSKMVEGQCGLSSAKLWMLWELFEHPGMKVSELAKALTIHPSTCSNMLDQLELKNLTRRERSTTDQRAVHLYLTDDGTQLLATAPRPAQGKLSEALKVLSDDDQIHLQEGLTRLIEVMSLENEKKAGLMPL